jgi:hypothetical protein
VALPIEMPLDCPNGRCCTVCVDVFCKSTCNRKLRIACHHSTDVSTRKFATFSVFAEGTGRNKKKSPLEAELIPLGLASARHASFFSIQFGVHY